MLDQLRQQMGGMFWVVAIAAPVMVLVLILQIVSGTRGTVKQVKKTFRFGSVVTDRTVPTTGPIAFGLACGAHMAVNQGVAWNDLAGSGFPKPELQANLAEMWGVHNHLDWQRAVEAKLAQRTDNLEHIAIELRREFGVRDHTGWRWAIDHDGWRQAIDQAAQSGRVPLHSVSALAEAAARVARIEDRFRADGLLSGARGANHQHGTGVVSSVRVYDWGRAVNLARWGLRAGYCDRAQAENVALRVGQLCVAHYASWADLSAGFALGRLLFFDDEDFPVHYVTVREAHRRLLDDAESPYRTLRWPAGISV